MKTRILLSVLALMFLAACADAPSEPDATPDVYTLHNPPPKGGALTGTWVDKWGARLTHSGILDLNIPATLTGDVRVSGNVVWFDLRGGGHRRLYCGVIDGDQIIGHEELSTWSESQGITSTFPAQPFNWTRSK